jgi:hypothetical protein
MNDRHGTSQRKLYNLRVQWGPQELRHLAVIPVFDRGYKVLGLVGLDSERPPVWYPGVPLVVQPRLLVMRSSLSDASPEWHEVEPGHLENVCFFDSWGAILALVPKMPGAPSLAGSVNLVGGRIRGQRIVDVIYESSLHRVRALRLRPAWGRARDVPILRIPALWENLEQSLVQPLDLEAFGPPPARPESWIERIARLVTSTRAPTDRPR